MLLKKNIYKMYEKFKKIIKLVFICERIINDIKILIIG